MDTIEKIRRAKEGDKEIREQLITENMGLVWSIVRRFLGRGYEAEDLFQIGSIGLMKAIDKFDESKVPAYIPITVTEESFEEDLKAGLYERYNYCNIYSAGNYYAEATNNHKKSSTKRKSEIATFPAPNAEKFIVKPLELKGNKIQQNESGFEDVILTVSAEVENPTKEKITYEWHKEGSEEIFGNENILNVTSIGKYFVKVYNTRNNVSINKISNTAWISLPAEKPVIVEGNDFNNERYPIGKNIEVSLTGRFTSNRYESYKIFWYKMQGEGPNPGDNTDDILIPSATNSFTLKTEGLEPGQYYVAIQSVYNDNISDFLITSPFNLY